MSNGAPPNLNTLLLVIVIILVVFYIYVTVKAVEKMSMSPNKWLGKELDKSRERIKVLETELGAQLRLNEQLVTKIPIGKRIAVKAAPKRAKTVMTLSKKKR